jgi:ABC-type multidrug transport system fused ATPase/permease subunit
LDVVQFASPIFFAEEDLGMVKLDVMRLGTLKGRVAVRYKTYDGSALAGFKYEATHGDLVFEEGVSDRVITVPIMNDDRWDPTLDFVVELEEPQACQLGNYLHKCSVKIIDDDVFPSNQFAELARKGRASVELIPSVSLIKSFIWFCYGMPGIKWDFWQTVAIMQLHNLYLYLTLYLNIYLVDVVFNTEEGTEKKLWLPNRVHTAYLVGASFFVPFIFLHAVDAYKLKLDLNAEVKKTVQKAIFRKYLNLSEQSARDFPPGVIALAVIKDSAMIVEKGFMKFLKIIAILVKLVIVAYFLLMECGSGATLVVPLILFPIAREAFMISHRLITHRDAQEDTFSPFEAQVVQSVTEACDKLSMIAAFNQREKINDIFGERVEALAEAMEPHEAFELHSKYVPSWVSTILVSAYTAWAATDVLSGQLSLGRFLATIRIFKEVGESFNELYEQWMCVRSTASALRDITAMLNSKTNLQERKHILEQRAHESHELRKTIAASLPDVPVPDLLPIRLHGVEVNYGGENVIHRTNCIAIYVTQGSGCDIWSACLSV